MKIKVNNKHYKININKELTILQACELINIHIPRFCYHDKLSIAGNCRMCFVELPKSKKPSLACSTTIHDGIELYINTFVVKKAQESVLEFLLLNHPLDCPICDQAGECDLQELTKNFGSDRGRFNEMKRSVEDIELGSVVKTIMTRCIHCTRCIRFASEILKIPALGTSGRGRDTEVSMYVNKILHSELSGNIVDLCPVGALTSKPYAFKARPWELSHTESIDILDSIGSSLRLDTKSNKIMRILPKMNDAVNEEWITDKVRYSYDSITLQRLTTPSIYIHRDENYLSTSWSFVMCMLTSYLLYYKTYKNSAVTVGNLIDYRTAYASKFLSESLYTNTINSGTSISDLRSNYTLSTNLSSIEKKEAYILVGTNLDYESPLIKLRIQKKNSKKKIYIIGSYWNSMIPGSSHVGTSLKSFIKILEGRHTVCYDMYTKNSIEFIYRYNSNMKGNINLIKLANKHLQELKRKYVHSYLGAVGLSNLSSHLGPIQSSEVGLNKSYKASTNYVRQKTNSINIHVGTHNDFYLPDHENFDSMANSFKVFIGHHKPNNLKQIQYDLILPATTYAESEYYFINNFNTILNTTPALGKLGKSKSYYAILFKIINKLSNVAYNSMSKKIANTIKNYQSIKSMPMECLHRLLLLDYYDVNFYSNIIIPHKLLYYYHCSDPLTFNSPMMVKLTKEKKNLESTFYKNITYSI